MDNVIILRSMIFSFDKSYTSAMTYWFFFFVFLYRTLEVPSSRIVILEGIYALSEKLRPLLDLRVSVTGGVHFDLVKRVLRDIQRAGQEPEEIIHQISETVFTLISCFFQFFVSLLSSLLSGVSSNMDKALNDDSYCLFLSKFSFMCFSPTRFILCTKRLLNLI